MPRTGNSIVGFRPLGFGRERGFRVLGFGFMVFRFYGLIF